MANPSPAYGHREGLGTNPFDQTAPAPLPSKRKVEGSGGWPTGLVLEPLRNPNTEVGEALLLLEEPLV